MIFLIFGLPNEQFTITEEIGNCGTPVDDPTRNVNLNCFSAGSKCLKVAIISIAS